MSAFARRACQLNSTRRTDGDAEASPTELRAAPLAVTPALGYANAARIVSWRYAGFVPPRSAIVPVER
jgi:hypothetical protein